MRIKTGVSLKNLCPQMVVAYIVANDVFSEMGYECVITSCDDSEHGKDTLHGQGKATDFRTRHLPDQNTKVAVKERLVSRLGEEYDVVLEADHMHVEFDPN